MGTINTLSKNPSKSDELCFLEAIAASVSPDSYLSSLFTTQFVQWVVKRIREDVGPDLYAWYENKMQEATATATEIQKLRNTIDRLKEEMEVLAGEKEEEIERVKANLELSRQNRQEWQDNYHDLHEQMMAVEAQLAAADRIILELKAKLYDHMTS